MLKRLFTAVFLLGALLGPAGASAQYLRITTDNAPDPTRLKATGTTVLTLTMDTSHDRNGILQTCNSHTIANGCGAPTTGQTMDMFSYTIALKAVGGTVTWGSFSAADAAYTDTSPQIQSPTEVEINKTRPTGTFSPAGVNILGTLPVTIASGSPRIDLQIGAGALNPYGFGNGFGTSCDAFFFANTYVLGDPTDPCGVVSGTAGDWFDWDGAGAPAVANRPPVLVQPASMTVNEGATADQALSGSDPDGDPLTFQLFSGPSYMTVTTTSPTTGNIHLAPGFSDAGTASAGVSAVDPSNASNTWGMLITVNNVNRGPILAPLSDMTVAEGATADQALSATDPDGDALTFHQAAGPSYATVTTTSPTTGNLHMAPQAGDAGGPHAVYVSVTDGLGGVHSQSMLVTVTSSTNAMPTLGPLVDMTVDEGATADQALTASDPDGNSLTFHLSAGPTYATVSTTGPTTGNLHVAPGSADAGQQGVGISVTDGFGGVDQRAIVVTVNNVDRPPILNPIPDPTVPEGGTADVPVVATDPDGDVITLAPLVLPPFALLFTTPTAGTVVGTLHIAPLFGSVGNYPVILTALSGTPQLASNQSFVIHVTPVNEPPVLLQPADMTTQEGTTATQQLNAFDPDGDALTFSKVSGPLYMTVSATGLVTLTPGSSDAGTTTGAARVSDGVLTDQKSFQITILNVNGAPVADAGGPYSGTVGVPVTFDGTGSSDPDGDALQYFWQFADLTLGTGSVVQHIYTFAATYTVQLTVFDGVLSDVATAQAVITNQLDALAFQSQAGAIKPKTGKPQYCFQVQPVGGDYNNSDVLRNTIVMKYNGISVPAETDKTALSSDLNLDGIAEIKACFSRSSMRTLFAGLGSGDNSVPVVIEGDLATGARFHASLIIIVRGPVSATAPVEASVSPNPLNPQTKLAFQTTKPGLVKVDMFDLQGRLVRSIQGATYLNAGVHEFTVDGRGQSGEKLPSGVYFIRGETAEGTFKNTITILK